MDDTPVLDTLDRAIINTLQHGLPICPRPYRQVAEQLGIDEATLLQRLVSLMDAGMLTRFGPLFQIEKMGGRFCLAAMSVPEEQFEDVARLVNAFPEVAHNYQRQHQLNMWFVVACPDPQAIQTTLERIETATGLAVLAMPKEKEFFVNLYLPA
ncbi:DNA-binding Lrp family transcriptional regulator [Chitinivorax tropicus]|uniref:Siroheme decarboxylase NirG subunit n=1 Tax=Chitinivorax tropicus TaxID=714531 RepID=A0A840MSE8_9PROT|nr:AsnC family transcriptional regulator [Chitinivorax tropicus]MBB5018141.1 DNA-binding Lrp family transcriptional regulator [Chitinivorax tropicus]